jgi:nascent polypeptide-associated complex subunit alpha
MAPPRFRPLASRRSVRGRQTLKPSRTLATSMMPGGMDPRQMAAMMRRMGIEVEEIAGVQEVVVRTATHEYRFKKASVSVMKAQGQETWQIQGKPERSERTSTGPAAAPSTASSKPAQPVQIPESDVELVMEHAGCDAATARRTLQETNGDLAEALVRLGA